MTGLHVLENLNKRCSNTWASGMCGMWQCGTPQSPTRIHTWPAMVDAYALYSVNILPVHWTGMEKSLLYNVIPGDIRGRKGERRRLAPT